MARHSMTPQEIQELLRWLIEIGGMGAIGFGLLKWGMLQMLDQTNKSLESLVKQRDGAIRELEKAFSTLEGRTVKLEISNEKKTRQLRNAAKENEILETALESTMTSLLKSTNKENRDVADSIAVSLAELRQGRVLAKQKDDEWEERIQVILIHTRGRSGATFQDLLEHESEVS